MIGAHSWKLYQSIARLALGIQSRVQRRCMCPTINRGGQDGRWVFSNRFECAKKEKGGAHRQSIRSPSHVILPVCARCATGVGENTKGKKKRRYDNGWHDMEGKASPLYILYLHSLLYILLLAVNSTDLHKETTRDAHVNSSVILLARGESREKKWPRTFRFPFLEREKERGEFSRKLSLNERGRRREARRKPVCRVVRGQRGECARHAGYAKLERSCVGRGRRVGGWGPKTDRIHDERQFRFCPSASFATEI